MADHIYQQTLTFNCGGQFAESIFHWKFDDSGFSTSAAAATALLAAWDAAYDPTFAGFYPSSTTLLTMKSRKVTGGGGFEVVLPITGGLVGTRGGNTLAAGVSPVAIFYPLDTSRKRGRWFIPGVTTNDLTNARYQAAYKTAIDALLGTQFDDLTLVGGGAPNATFVIFSRSSGLSFSPVLNKLSDTPGTQRRRQRPA